MKIGNLMRLISDEMLVVDVFTSTMQDLHHTLWCGTADEMPAWALECNAELMYVDNDRLCIGIV